MRAMLLAAGLGTRLRPITDTVPKCLVPIGGKPLLQIWLEKLSEAGFGPFLINTHYLHERVEEFVESSPFRDQITLTYESDLLGTAGTLSKNVEFFQGEDGAVLHADNYCLADLKEFKNAHKERPKECLMTMMTFRTGDPKSCGIVELDDKGIVVGFHEKVKSPPGDLANGAIYIFSREAFDFIVREDDFIGDISNDLIPLLMRKIFTYVTAEVFVDIGTPERYGKLVKTYT